MATSTPTRIDNITHVVLLRMKDGISALERRAVCDPGISPFQLDTPGYTAKKPQLTDVG
jgi:hypothetical protein